MDFGDQTRVTFVVATIDRLAISEVADAMRADGFSGFADSLCREFPPDLQSVRVPIRIEDDLTSVLRFHLKRMNAGTVS